MDDGRSASVRVDESSLDEAAVKLACRGAIRIGEEKKAAMTMHQFPADLVHGIERQPAAIRTAVPR
jgi:hypothetical protein